MQPIAPGVTSSHPMRRGPRSAPRLADGLEARLAALGPLLCLYRAGDTHPLTGLADARRVAPLVRIDSDGPFEALAFLAGDGRPCWQLCLLPDSDWFCWDAMLAQLGQPMVLDCAQPARACGEGIRRAAGSPRWRASAIRLHAAAQASPCGLAASVAPLSTCGHQAAERLARAAGAEYRPEG